MDERDLEEMTSRLTLVALQHDREAALLSLILDLIRHGITGARIRTQLEQFNHDDLIEYALATTELLGTIKLRDDHGPGVAWTLDHLIDQIEANAPRPSAELDA